MDRELTSPARIHWLMELMDWDPHRLAQEAGLATSTLQRFLKGRRTLGAAARGRLLIALEKETADRRGKLEALKAVGSEEPSGRQLALTVLRAALRYSAQHQENPPEDDIDAIITQQLETFLDGLHAPVEIAKALGIYVSRLEISLAKAQRRIAELETQQLPLEDDAVPAAVGVA